MEFFAGESAYVVVFGDSIEEEPILVWVGEDELHEEKAADGVNKSDIRNMFKERHGTVEVLRITPGKLGDVYVWEAYFKKMEEKGQRRYYEYYQFSTGEWLDTYQLRLEELH